MWGTSLCSLTIGCLDRGVGFSPAQETRRNYHPLSEQEHLHTPLLMSGMRSHCGPCSVSLLQLCPLHRESLIFSGWFPVCNFWEQTFWKDSGGHSRWEEMDVLLLGSLWGVARTLNPCHFIIYRHVFTVSGAQLLSGIQLFAILWTVAARLSCPWNFPGKNTGVGCYLLLQGIFLTQGSNSHLLNWQADSLLLSYWGNPIYRHTYSNAEFNSYSSFMVLADVVTSSLRVGLDTHLKVSTAFLPNILESCTLGAGPLCPEVSTF